MTAVVAVTAAQVRPVRALSMRLGGVSPPRGMGSKISAVRYRPGNGRTEVRAFQRWSAAAGGAVWPGKGGGAVPLPATDGGWPTSTGAGGER